MLSNPALEEPALPPFSMGDYQLRDHSQNNRTGVRGSGANQYLEAQQYALPITPNRALHQQNGALMLRLSQHEFWLLEGESTQSIAPFTALQQTQLADHCYPLFNQESHAWFELSGPDVSSLMAHLCGVDLSPSAFPDLHIAQTVAARINVIVLRHDSPTQTRFSLFCDRSFAAYLWQCLQDVIRNATPDTPTNR